MLRIGVSYDVAGQWMFHTHLLDQASHGMMGVIDVRAGDVGAERQR
jgi:FtsP/CotA-like multicopper oxidase with cupredoxin domain